MKSYVGIGITQCPICMKTEKSILLDKQLKETLNPEQFLGWAYCEEHSKLLEEGYAALVEVEEPATSMEDAKLTGRYALVRKKVADEMFSEPVAEYSFVEVGVIDKLKEVQDHSGL